MAGDARRVRILRGAALLTALLASPGPTRAQDARIPVDDSTAVGRVAFEIEGELDLGLRALRAVMATRGSGLGRGLQAAVSWLPGVRAPAPLLFDPVTLQMDVVRLRELLVESGYPAAAVDYRVDFDQGENRVDLTLLLEPGPPRLLEGLDLELTTADSATTAAAPALERELVEAWTGRRLGDDEVGRIGDRALAWARERGHAFPAVTVAVEAGRDPFVAGATVHLDPGPVTSVERITLEGEPRLDPAVVLRHLTLQPGDTVTSERIDRGQRMLQGLDLVNAAFVQVEPGTEAGTAELRVRLREGNPRIVSGRAGYADDEGVLAEGRFEHRDFLGGARVLRVSATATTGVGALADFARRYYGASVSLIQPHLFQPELRLVSTLYGFRDDGQRELAEEVGGEVGLVYAPGPDRFLSVGYSVSSRRVLESRGIGGASLDLFELLELLDDLEGRITQTAFNVSGSWGRRDDLANPTRGWLLGGSADLAGADPWSTTQFLRAEATGSVLHPLWDGRVQVLARARVGRLWPFGRSRQAGGDPAEAYLRLGDDVFTAGGTGTVRGWQTGLLGPKFPGLEVDAEAEAIVPAGRWVPLGGLSRWAASVELQAPLGGRTGGPYALAFLDVGRVWTPDPLFTSTEGLPLDVGDGSFAGVGGGIGVPTPVGPVRIMLGYKLNPGSLDLRDSDAVLEEFLSGAGDLDAVPRSAWGRWRIHFAIGQPF